MSLCAQVGPDSHLQSFVISNERVHHGRSVSSQEFAEIKVNPKYQSNVAWVNSSQGYPSIPNFQNLKLGVALNNRGSAWYPHGQNVAGSIITSDSKNLVAASIQAHNENNPKSQFLEFEDAYLKKRFPQKQVQEYIRPLISHAHVPERFQAKKYTPYSSQSEKFTNKLASE